MGVTRKQLTFEGKFVQIPNEWVRDARLSRRSRGLLAEIMSHRVGWHISISSLQSAGVEGRDAIRSSLAELLETGYLTRAQTRGEAGRFNEVEYDLSEPVTADGKPVSGGFTGSGSPDSGSAARGESDTKNTISKEHDPSENENTKSIVQATPAQVLESEFAEWWKVYPRKQAKPDALKAFKAARKTTDLDTLTRGAQAYALLNLGGDRSKVKMPAGWLRSERWADEDQIPAEDHSPPWMKQDALIVHHMATPAECVLHRGYPVPCDRCARDREEGRDF
jgi:hypothetical protein